MTEKGKPDKKKGAIFRMEEIDGKLYRVMYYKNNKGGLTRSKFIREVKRKEKKKGRPTKATRATINKQLILENRKQINNNTRNIHSRPQSRTVNASPKPVARRTKVQTPQPTHKPGHKYIKPSGASQSMIDEWKSKVKRR